MSEDALGRDLVSTLESVPFEPRRTWTDPRYYGWLTKSALDSVAHNFPRSNALLVRLNPYPAPWEPVRVPVDDEADFALGGWYGPGREGAPAVLYAPGTFQTKDDTPRKARAIRMWRELGWHVLVVDMRGFGESASEWGTGGYVEARDLHAAARWLRDRAGVRRVALMGDSLGGSSALIASALPGARDLFCGTTAWSPFGDLASQVAYSSKDPGPRHPYFVPYHIFRFMLHRRSGGKLRTFEEFVAERSAMLDLTPEELVRRASPATYAKDVVVPTLVHHAMDDPIVPVEQARLLARAFEGNPRVRVRVLPTGGHASFDYVAPRWFWATVAAFVGGVSPPAPARFTMRLRAPAVDGGAA